MVMERMGGRKIGQSWGYLMKFGYKRFYLASIRLAPVWDFEDYEMVEFSQDDNFPLGSN